MLDLLDRKTQDFRAAKTVALFCFRGGVGRTGHAGVHWWHRRELVDGPLCSHRQRIHECHDGLWHYRLASGAIERGGRGQARYAPMADDGGGSCALHGRY